MSEIILVVCTVLLTYLIGCVVNVSLIETGKVDKEFFYDHSDKSYGFFHVIALFWFLVYPVMLIGSIFQIWHKFIVRGLLEKTDD